MRGNVKRRKIFRDIVRGYSTTMLDEDFVYIKHLTPHDQVELEEIEEKYHNDSTSQGRAHRRGYACVFKRGRSVEKSLTINLLKIRHIFLKL